MRLFWAVLLCLPSFCYFARAVAGRGRTLLVFTTAGRGLEDDPLSSDSDTSIASLASPSGPPDLAPPPGERFAAVGVCAFGSDCNALLSRGYP